MILSSFTFYLFIVAFQLYAAFPLLSIRRQTRVSLRNQVLLRLQTTLPSDDNPSQHFPVQFGETIPRRHLAGAITLLLTRDAFAVTPFENEVSDRVRLMVRIAPTLASRADDGGRRAEQNEAEEGEIILGLYEKQAPETVRTFLSYCVPGEFENSDGELERRPSLDSAVFWRMVPGEAIDAGRVPGLNEVQINGARVLKFAANRRVYPLGESRETNSIKHNRRGLLTKRAGMVGPEFSVTLGPSPQLDGRAVVFGEVLSGGEAGGILDDIEHIAIYTGRAATESGAFADAVFQAQKQAMLGTAKAIGDTRVSDLQGKLLRKVEVRAVQRLE